MFRHCIAALALLGFATVSFAEESAATPAAPAAAPAPAPAPAKPGKDPNEMICSVEPVIGSNIRKRVCMTRADREARTKIDRDAMAAQRNPGGQPGL
jgi:hypothetical protein